MTDQTRSKILSNLPSYTNPPVNEVVCGFRFKKSEKLMIPHIGYLWNYFKDEYPKVQHAAPIVTGRSELLSSIELNDLPVPRVWFINTTEDQLIQFQLDRFYYNWRQKEGSYPRYSNVIRNFESAYDNLVSFYREFDLGGIEIIEHELTYVNHVPFGRDEDIFKDTSDFLTNLYWSKDSSSFLPNPTKLSWRIEFSLPENNGRLIVTLNQGIRNIDGATIMVLELRAVGRSKQTEGNQEMRNWYNLSHEWIVRGFTDMTKAGAHKVWGLENV